MGLVTERMYDPSKPLYFAANSRFDGRDYAKGDEAPVKDMSQRTIMKYFRTGYFVHQVREMKSAVVEEPVKETEEVVEEAPKTTRKRRTKKDTE